MYTTSMTKKPVHLEPPLEQTSFRKFEEALDRILSIPKHVIDELLKAEKEQRRINRQEKQKTQKK